MRSSFDGVTEGVIFSRSGFDAKIMAASFRHNRGERPKDDSSTHHHRKKSTKMKWKALYTLKEIVVLLVLLLERISALRVLYPEHPLNAKAADEPYQPEYLSLQEKGIACSLFDFDGLVGGYGEFRPRPPIKPKEAVLYRGWMMTPAKYQDLIRSIENLGAEPITSVADYTRCHHLPGWYSTCAELTAETHFLDPDDDDVPAAAAKLGWDRFFVKDFVKSNTGDKGSIARTPAEIPKSWTNSSCTEATSKEVLHYAR